MAVFVDNGATQYRHMKMCHMIADTTEELLKMADTIGVRRRWIQLAGTSREHFDICQSKRCLAIKAGAVPISARDLVRRLRAKEKDHELA